MQIFLFILPWKQLINPSSRLNWSQKHFMTTNFPSSILVKLFKSLVSQSMCSLRAGFLFLLHFITSIPYTKHSKCSRTVGWMNNSRTVSIYKMTESTEQYRTILRIKHCGTSTFKRWNNQEPVKKREKEWSRERVQTMMVTG